MYIADLYQQSEPKSIPKMPQHRTSRNCQRFVNPSDLHTSFPLVYDNMADDHHYGPYSDLDASMVMNSFHQDGLFDIKFAQGWKGEPLEYSMASMWPTETRTSTPSIGDDCSGTSASTPPSPGNTCSQQSQSYKRRAQNRAA